MVSLNSKLLPLYQVLKTKISILTYKTHQTAFSLAKMIKKMLMTMSLKLIVLIKLFLKVFVDLKQTTLL